MKLTRPKLIETIRRKNEGITTYQVRKIADISIRGVNQVCKQFPETGRIPELKKAGRRKRIMTEEEKRIVAEAYEKYKEENKGRGLIK